MRRNNKLILYSTVVFLIISTLGCDSFVRKFTREKKRQEMIEPVLSPEENAGLFYDNETKYKNYFAYWRAWHDELVQCMYQASKKRKRYCANQAIENLQLMSALLTGPRQKEMNGYIEKMEKIRSDIESDLVIDQNLIVQRLKNIRLSVNDKLDYKNVKEWIKQ